MWLAAAPPLDGGSAARPIVDPDGGHGWEEALVCPPALSAADSFSLLTKRATLCRISLTPRQAIAGTIGGLAAAAEGVATGLDRWRRHRVLGDGVRRTRLRSHPCTETLVRGFTRGRDADGT
jgi:hypothetical protein